MKKSKSNITLWLLLIAALGGGAAYLIIRNRNKKQAATKRQTGLLVKPKNIQKNAGLTGCNL